MSIDTAPRPVRAPAITTGTPSCWRSGVFGFR